MPADGLNGGGVPQPIQRRNSFLHQAASLGDRPIDIDLSGLDQPELPPLRVQEVAAQNIRGELRQSLHSSLPKPAIPKVSQKVTIHGIKPEVFDPAKDTLPTEHLASIIKNWLEGIDPDIKKERINFNLEGTSYQGIILNIISPEHTQVCSGKLGKAITYNTKALFEQNPHLYEFLAFDLWDI